MPSFRRIALVGLTTAAEISRSNRADELNSGVRVDATTGDPYRETVQSKGGPTPKPWLFPVTCERDGHREGALACAGVCPLVGTGITLWTDPDDPDLFIDHRGEFRHGGPDDTDSSTRFITGLVLVAGGAMSATVLASTSGSRVSEPREHLPLHRWHRVERPERRLPEEAPDGVARHRHHRRLQ